MDGKKKVLIGLLAALAVETGAGVYVALFASLIAAKVVGLVALVLVLIVTAFLALIVLQDVIGG